jgi:hypothetical protein
MMNRFLVFSFALLLLTTCDNSTGSNSEPDESEGKIPVVSQAFDWESNGIPKFIDQLHVDMEQILRISKFRSSAGHDYSDAYETCRSIKHYVVFNGFPIDWHEIEIRSPINGRITWIQSEGGPRQGGYQVWVESDQYPGIIVSIFHMDVDESLTLGDRVTKNQVIGTHSNETFNDIGIQIFGPTDVEEEYAIKMVSIFEVMEDSYFNSLSDYGLNTFDDVIISKEVRDQNPLTCRPDPSDLGFVGDDPLFTGDDSHAWFFPMN